MAKLSVELERYFFEEERASNVKLADILSLAGERIFGFLFVTLAFTFSFTSSCPRLLHSFWNFNVSLGYSTDCRI